MRPDVVRGTGCGQAGSLLGNQRGSAIMLFALVLPVLLGIGALAVDAAHLYVVRTQLQIAADAAALAAVRELPNEGSARTKAQQYALMNVSSADKGEVLRMQDIEVGRWDSSARAVVPAGGEADAVRVRVGRTRAAGNAVPTFFAGLFGFREVDVTAEAIAATGTRGMELVLVLDVSGSMGGGGKIEALRSAALKLVDIVYGDRETSPDLRVGLAPFSGRVNIVNYGADWMDSDAGGSSSDNKKKQDDKSGLAVAKLCTGLRTGSHQRDDTPPGVEPFPPFAGDDKACPGPPALALTAEKSVVTGAIGALYTGHGTSTHVGTVWGWRLISPRWRGLWGDPDLPLDYEAPTDKVMVIMTDGKNHPNQSGDPYTEAQVNQQLLQMCADMKTLGVIIFTVTFQAPDDIDHLYEECASEAGYWFDSPTNADLEAAFEAIGGHLGGGARLVH